MSAWWVDETWGETRREADRKAFRIVISACLGGEAVRWDGGHERREFITRTLARHAELIAVCPEVGMGLPVPREPIQLVRAEGGFDVYGVHSKRDYTPTLTDWIRRRVTELARLDPDAVILKSRSPSCGLDGARVFETREALLAEDGPWVRGGRGLFAAAVVEAFPDRPVVDEEVLATPEGRTRFVRRLGERGRGRDTADALAALTALAALRADLDRG